MGIGISLPASGGVTNIGKPPSSSQPMSMPPLQPSRTPMGGLQQRGGPPIRQQSEELSSSPYSSLEEANGCGSFPGGTVVYQSDPRTGTTFIVPSNISMLGGGATGSYRHGPSSLEGYTVPSPSSNNVYSGYDHAKGGGRISLDSYPKGTRVGISMCSSYHFLSLSFFL